MIETILTKEAFIFLTFTFGSGYVALLWGYRDANKLEYFYGRLSDFDKSIQTFLSGAIIAGMGYYVNPDIFNKIFAQTLTSEEIKYLFIMEILFILVLSSLIAYIVKTYTRED